MIILTRIKEARDRGLGSRAAVARGISVTSGTITSAASIMVVVFAVFRDLQVRAHPGRACAGGARAGRGSGRLTA